MNIKKKENKKEISKKEKVVIGIILLIGLVILFTLIGFFYKAYEPKYEITPPPLEHLPGTGY